MNLNLEQIIALGNCERKLRDQSTILGFGWTLLNPLLNWLVLYMVFAPWVQSDRQSYSFYLLIGLVYWNAFNTITSTVLSAYDRRRFLAWNVPLSPLSLFGASFYSVLYVFLIENIIVVFLLGVAGSLHIHALWTLPLAFILLSLLGLFCGMLLAILNTFIRDTAHLWSIVLRLGFFLTPVFLPHSFLLERPGWEILNLNPMVGVLSIARSVSQAAIARPTEIYVIPAAWVFLLGCSALLAVFRAKRRLVEAV